jgi:hypothetical protein
LKVWIGVAVTSDGCKTPCSRRACSPFPAVAARNGGQTRRLHGCEITFQITQVARLTHQARFARRNKIRAHEKSFCILPQSADPVCEIARRHRRRPLFGYSFAAINQPDGKTRARATRSDNFRQNRRDRPTEANRSIEKRRVQKFKRHLCADERRLRGQM